MEEHFVDVKTKMKGLFCFILLLEMCSSSCCDAARTMDMERQRLIDIDNYLKDMNRTPVKTIQSPDGRDIIDCVDFYKQPGCDITDCSDGPRIYPEWEPKEITPSRFFPGEELNKMYEERDAEPIQTWEKNGRCPAGTVPIRRILKEDVLRAGSVARFLMKGPGYPGSSFHGLRSPTGDEQQYVEEVTEESANSEKRVYR